MPSPTLERTATPGIYKRGGRYVAIYRDPSGQQRKVFARTIKGAKNRRAEKVADVSRGEWRNASRVRFADYATEWIASYQGRTERGVRESTLEDYRDIMEREAIPYFGRLLLTEVETSDVKAFTAKLRARGLKPASVRKTLAPIRAMFADAKEEGKIRSNPTSGVRVTAPEEIVEDGAGNEAKALSATELGAFLEAVPSWWRPFFEFLAQSGLRIGEAIEVRWKDVNFHGSDIGPVTLHVRRSFSRGRVTPPKSKHGTRKLRLSPVLSSDLRALRRETGADVEELVFPAPQGGRINAHNLLARVVKPTAVEIGLGEWVKTPRARRASSWVGCHTFRHTCASILFVEGRWNAKQVQLWLGHHSPGFTLERYVHLLPEDLPEPTCFDALGMGNKWATQTPEIDRDGSTTPEVETADLQQVLSAAFGTSGA